MVRPARATTMRIDVISDTHGLQRPGALKQLAGVELIHRPFLEGEMD